MLNERALLTNLYISSWSARKYDAGVSSEVEKTHGAKDAGRFNKLLIDNTDLKKLEKIAGAARAHHYKFTLPWGDNGDRILPTQLFNKYRDGARQLRSDYDAAAREFVELYPTLVQDARKRLGTMYNPADYPAQGDIKRRFEMRVDYTPVPNADDFRVNINAEAAEQIKNSVIASVSERQEKAAMHAKARMKEVLTKFCERMSEPDPIFRESLLGNIRSESELLPAFNLAGDEYFTNLCEAVEHFLQLPVMTTLQLRNSEEARSRAYRAAHDVLVQYF